MKTRTHSPSVRAKETNSETQTKGEFLEGSDSVRRPECTMRGESQHCPKLDTQGSDLCECVPRNGAS